MRVRRLLRIALVTGVAVAALAACKDPAKSSAPQPTNAFCNAATRYDQAIQTPGKGTQADQAAAQVPLVEQMAANAPADLKHAADVFLEALRRRAAGDTSVVDNRSVKQAVDDVNRRAGQGCGFYQSQDGSGGM